MTALVRLYIAYSSIQPLSIQVCLLTVQTCQTTCTFHPLLTTVCNGTFRNDSWLWPGTWFTVTVYIHMYLPDWLIARLECFGFPHCPSKFVHCLFRHVYCLSIVDYEMKNIQKRFLIIILHSEIIFLITWFWHLCDNLFIKINVSAIFLTSHSYRNLKRIKPQKSETSGKLL